MAWHVLAFTVLSLELVSYLCSVANLLLMWLETTVILTWYRISRNTQTD